MRNIITNNLISNNKTKKLMNKDDKGAIVATTTIAASTLAGLLPSIFSKNENYPDNQNSSSIKGNSNSFTKYLPEVIISNLVKVKEIFKIENLKQMDNKTRAKVGALVSTIILGGIFLRRQKGKKITNTEIQLEKLIEQKEKLEKSSVPQSPVSKGVNTRILKLGALILFGGLANKYLKSTLKK